MFKFANPKQFKRFSRPAQILAFAWAALLFVTGIYFSLFNSPPDYLQSETVRIMYIHVPAAWLSMFVYATLGTAALSFLIWRHTLAALYIRAAAPLGAGFTLICLVTGAIWGQPTWGTWWVWDARLTSVLILLFLYIGIIVLDQAYEDEDKGLEAASWLSIIGLVNLPIIKFSVDWWNTLHQPASLTSLSKLSDPSIDGQMLLPLLLMAGAYFSLFTALGLMRLDTQIMKRKAKTKMLRNTRTNTAGGEKDA